MLRDAAIAEIQKGLGFRTDQFDNCVSALRQAQRLLERGRTLPYFLEVSADLLAPIGYGAIDLPVGFLREVDDSGPRRVQENGDAYYLEKIDHHQSRLIFEGYDPGSPQAYTLRKATIEVYPERDIAYTLRWAYYKAGESLATNSENEWLNEEYGAPEVLIGRAGMLVAEDLFNQAAYEKFQKRFLEAYAGMLGDTIQRQEANKPLYMAGRT